MIQTDILQRYMHQIVDEMHPLFTAVSDENMVEHYGDRGVFERQFEHQNGKTFLMRWTVYFGSPETVRTVFEPAKEI